MYSAAERDRKLAAAQKRLDKATADRERYEEKADEAGKRIEVEAAQIEWLEQMPVAPEPDDDPESPAAA